MARLSPADRFWSYVRRGAPEACWPWTGALSRRGYGKLWFNGAVRQAHRVVLPLVGRDCPDDRVVRHACDNPRCVNPGHLLLGSQADNSRDARERGRLPRGEDAPRAKLTDAAVAEIRLRLSVRRWGEVRRLAAEYGASETTIGRIKRGESRPSRS